MIKTNKDNLITLAVQGEIVPAQIERQYQATWDGRAKLCIGVGGINYNLKIGSKVFGWVNGDRAEPGVCTDNTGSASQKNGYRTKASLGNEVKLLSGEAKGERGVVVGKHGYRLPGGAHHVLLHFGDETVERLAIGDKILVKACGIGLEIEGYEDVLVRSLGPSLLEAMGVTVEDGELVVPVVAEIPGWILGACVGWDASVEVVDYDIQTTCPEVVEELNLKSLRLGDVIAIPDHCDTWGRGRFEGAMTIGVIVHGFSSSGGHGPGVNPIMAALPGKIKTKIDPHANVAYYLGIRNKPKK